jgi:hypothetical protein
VKVITTGTFSLEARDEALKDGDDVFGVPAVFDNDDPAHFATLHAAPPT